MFYSMKKILLICLASFSGMHAQSTVKEQLISFLKGAAPVVAGIRLSHAVGKCFLGSRHEYEYITVLLGALGGAVVDHYYLGGAEDENQTARKLGHLIPVMISGGKVCYEKNTTPPGTRPYKLILEKVEDETDNNYYFDSIHTLKQRRDGMPLSSFAPEKPEEITRG